MQFNTAQGAFLGGYLAAGMSKTGKVATWGGLNIPPVTIYMDGFWEGVQYYNQQNHKNVQVLGWNEKNQKGGHLLAVVHRPEQGQADQPDVRQQGADIIFPVAGGAGLGAGAAAQASGGKVNVIWVDTDGCVSAAAVLQVLPHQRHQGPDRLGADRTCSRRQPGTFPTGSYVGTLQNGGTGLAPFHDFESKVPADLQTQLAKVKAGITDGTIKITSPSQPTRLTARITHVRVGPSSGLTRSCVGPERGRDVL